MKRNKLQKFAEMKTFSCVFQYPFAKLQAKGFDLKGRWHEQYFHNSNPIVVELGCGKGEYTVGLATASPDKNYIGIDIKGARIWKGAKAAEEAQMGNVAFLRTSIELIEEFFAPGEVDEIWITFPDPQMQKTRKRLVSSRFLTYYGKVLRPGGSIHLKTDSPFLYTFSKRMVEANGLPVDAAMENLYADTVPGDPFLDKARSIRTFYEQQWLARGKTIKLLSFRLTRPDGFSDPDESDIPRDDYHSQASFFPV